MIDDPKLSKMNFDNLNNVSNLGSVKLVGVAHEHKESDELVARVIESSKPDLIAIEQSLYLPYHEGEISGIERAKQYAMDMNTPILLLDKYSQDLVDTLREDLERVTHVANSLQSEVDRIGDIDHKVVTQSRNNVRDQFGRGVYESMYIDREITMARRLKKAEDTQNKRILGVVGCFHLSAIEEFYQIVGSECDLKDKIILPYGRNTRWSKCGEDDT